MNQLNDKDSTRVLTDITFDYEGMPIVTRQIDADGLNSVLTVPNHRIRG